MSLYSVISQGWKARTKNVVGVLSLFCVVFMLPLPVSALQTALVRTSNGDVYQIRFRNEKDLPDHVFANDFSIYDRAGEVKICLDWYRKEQPVGQRWRLVAAELWTAARILAKTPRRTPVFNTFSLANSLNKAAAELILDVAEKEVVGQLVSQIANHTPLKVLNIVSNGGPIAVIAIPASFLAKLGTIEIKMRRLLYAFWLASGWADAAIQLQKQANQRADQLWNAIDAGEVVDIFGGNLELDGKSGEIRGKASIEGPLRLRLVAAVYQQTAEKAGSLGVNLGKSKQSWWGWLRVSTGFVGDILGLLEEAGGALKTKTALQQLYNNLGREIARSLRDNVDHIYGSSYDYYKGGFCEPGVFVKVWYGSSTVVEGSGFTYTVVLRTQPDHAVTVRARSNNPDVTVLPASLTFTPNNWYEPKTFTVRTVADTDSVNDRASINHVVKGYGNITSAGEVLVIVIEGAPLLTEKFPNQTLTMGISSKPLDLSEYFRDPDGDPLTYAVWPQDTAVVRIAKAGSRITITIEPQRVGSTEVIVEARDPGGLTAWQKFTVTVQEAEAAPIPDLIVESISVSKSTLVPGERFTLSATVRNRGTAKSQSGVLRYYGPNLAEVGTRNLRRLAPNQASEASITLEASDEAGTYYYDACVSKVRDEINKDNNCSTRIAITVGMPVNQVPIISNTIPARTLIAGSASVVVDVSGNFRDPDNDRLSYAVHSDNTGVATANVSGSQATLTPKNAGIATITVTASDGELTATQRFFLTVTAVPITNRAPVTVGVIPDQTLSTNGSVVRLDLSNYFRDADSDTLTYTIASDNPNVAFLQVAGGRMSILPLGTVGRANVRVTASDGSLMATQSFTVLVQAAQPINQPPAAIGTIAGRTLTSNGTAQRVDVSSYFQDSDGDRLTYTARSANTNVSTVSVSGSVITITPQGAGSTTLHVTASDGALSATQSIFVAVTAAPPVQDPASFDLAIQSVRVSKDTLVPSESFTLSVTIQNNGPGVSVAASLSYYYSFIQGRTPEDQIQRQGTVGLDSLASGESTTKSFTLNAPSTPKTYYYGAWLSANNGDTNLYNDVSTEVGVTVQSPNQVIPQNSTPPVAPPDGIESPPDLVVESIWVSDDTLEPGASFKLYATVVNRGAGLARRSTTLRYYRSTDSRISTNDTQEDTDSVNPLNPDEKTEEWDSLRVPNSPGTYYYGVCVDSVNGESNTNNNCSTAIRITVELPAPPDLIVESVSVDEHTLEPGERFRFEATVRNQGTAESARTDLHYYLSTDANISESDTHERSDSIGRLDADETSKEWVTLTAPNSPGTYYFGACVDSVTNESNTGNNCSRAIRITVQGAQPPGLRVGDSIVVQNARGGGLNGLIVRNGAGIGFAHIISVFNGATGTITDGPQHANGFTWWKIHWDRSDQVFCDVNPCVGWVFELFEGARVITKPGLAAPTLNAMIPTKTTLLPNYPNPFNPETWIPYQIAEPTEVNVSIYSADGKLIRTLALGHQVAGIYQSKGRATYWDGRNSFGERVASGLYFYTFTAGDFTATRKMLIRK